MIKIVKKSGKFIIRCGAVETLIAPMELKEVSRSKIKLLKSTKCGLLTNITYSGEQRIKNAC